MSDAIAVLNLLKAVNTGFAAARQLRIGIATLNRLYDQRERLGRNLVLDDLQDIKQESREAHEGLGEAIRQHGGTIDE